MAEENTCGVALDLNKYCRCGKRAKSGLYCPKCQTGYHDACAARLKSNYCCNVELIAFNLTSDTDNFLNVGKSCTRQTSFSLDDIAALVSVIIKKEANLLKEEIVTLKMEILNLKECNEKLVKMVEIQQVEIADKNGNVDIKKSNANRQVNNPKQVSYASKIKTNKPDANNGISVENVSSDFMNKNTTKPENIHKNTQQIIHTDTTDGKKQPTWATVVGRKNNARKRCVIIGTNSEESVAVAKKAWLFVSKYKINYQEENVIEYLKKNNPDREFICEKIKNLGHFNSFKVGVDFDLKDKYLDPEIWPKGITVTNFLFRRRLKTDISKEKIMLNAN